MAKFLKPSVVLPLCALGAIAIGAASLVAVRTVGKTIDDSVLYIGIPESHGGMPVSLNLRVESKNGSASREYTPDELSPLESQGEGLVFLDYASDPLVELGGKSIGEWLAEDGNTLTASTTCLSLITSAEAPITESGIYLVNVASEDGATAEVSHSYVYGGSSW